MTKKPNTNKNSPTNYSEFYDSNEHYSKVEQFKSRFKPYTPPKSVVPTGFVSDCALDAGARIDDFAAAAPIDIINNWMQDGLGFQGYPRLAELIQRSEFRIPADVLARECVREWIKFTGVQGDNDDPEAAEQRAERISKIEAEFKRLGVRRIAEEFLFDGLAYGVGHVFIDIDNADPDSKLILDDNNIKIGSLKSIKRLEALWCYPNNYDASNPLSDSWYRPDSWWVSAIQIDESRLIHNIPFPVSDIFKPSFNFGGLSLSQQLLPYVRNYLSLRDSIESVTNNFSKLVIKTDMLARLGEPGYGTKNILGRLNLMEKISSGQGKVLIDKESEDLSVVSTPLAGLKDLLQQSMESMSGVARMPLLKRFGITPSGLNASGAGEITSWYDNVSSHQESNLRPFLEKILNIVQLSLFGDIDESISFVFEPLEQMDSKEQAEISALKAEADSTYIENGVLSPEEVRDRIIHDPLSLYSSVNLTDDSPAPEKD